VLEEFTARFPSLRLVTGQKFRFMPNVSFRGPLVACGVGGVDSRWLDTPPNLAALFGDFTRSEDPAD
jgi:hypothetical protein